MEGEAFARARRFLDYSPVAKWSALIAAVGTGVLFVALLGVLGLFVDLVVSRGEIPSFRDLPPQAQAYFWDRWRTLPEQDWKELIQESGVQDPKQIKYLATAEPQSLSPRDQELLRGQIYQLLKDQVGADAAEVVVGVRPDQPLPEQGILSLVVRSQDEYYGGLVSRLVLESVDVEIRQYHLPGRSLRRRGPVGPGARLAACSDDSRRGPRYRGSRHPLTPGCLSPHVSARYARRAVPSDPARPSASSRVSWKPSTWACTPG